MREDPNYIEGQVDAFFVEENIKVEVAQFYGIEIQAYAVSVARVGLWLMDHLMNVEASQLFGITRRCERRSGGRSTSRLVENF